MNEFRRSLLILDDVWSAHIIKTFDVCGRILVTTQDISVLDVVSKNNFRVVKIEHGFTEEESLKVIIKKIITTFLKDFVK
jgi:hypothetical protein